MRLFIRTETSNLLGMGHFMRCFALAEAARARGITVCFFLNELNASVLARVKSIGADAICVGPHVGGAEDFAAWHKAKLSHKDWVLVDSYQADETYIRMMAKASRVAVIDDLNLLPRYDCDLIINPALAASHLAYATKSSARLLLGAKFALIRQEFRQGQVTQSQVKLSADPRLSIMFGGSDPSALTDKCAKILRQAFPDTPITAIVGPANAHAESLALLEQSLGHLKVIFNPTSVAESVADSALVITAAGGSVGELAAMGLAALVLVVYDNQAAALEACPFPAIDARLGIPAGFVDDVRLLLGDKVRRDQIAHQAHALVDGNGPPRIVETMFNV